MNTWIEGCGQSGNWFFTSADRQHRYFGSMTLRMIGETTFNSGIVNLRVERMDEPEPRPTSEIFGHVNDECHYIEVEPELRLYEVLRCLPGRPRELEHNGALLNLEETADEAGLKNNDVVQECRRQISVSVKLSSGETMIFQVAENSFVLHLFDKVKKYETGDFSLMDQGRHLHMQDRVRDLKQVVEVSRAQFVVDIDGQRISWITRSEPITFPEFISQLSCHGQFGNEELETMEFFCVGCRRCISEDIQVLPIQCCRERSLTLAAKSYSNTRTLVDSRAIVSRIPNQKGKIHKRSVTDVRTDALRNFCRQAHESLVAPRLISAPIVEVVRRDKERLMEVTDAVNVIKKENECLKAKNKELQKELEIFEASTKKLKANAENNRTIIRSLYENSGVKLLVYYLPSHFSPVDSRPEIEQKGKYAWAANHHIKCFIPKLQAGLVSFEIVRDALQSLFSGSVIRVIGQGRSSVNRKDITLVTCRGDDESPSYRNLNEYCGEDGQLVTWTEAGKPRQPQILREGDQVLISGGQRRTVLVIRHS